MKSVILDKVYSPESFEKKIYEKSLKNKDFEPNENEKEYFSIVMPPPNVTGILHMGHALNMTLQDIIVRYNRMIGKSTLWIPGTDHAGIATQHVMEVELLKEGKRRTDFTREDFVARTEKLKDRHHDIIVSQIKEIASSCDWSKERFTLDEGFSRAVREAFCTLYERGLIYQGEYLVNYCPHCQTALSDDEVEYKSVDSFLYYINYPFSDGSGSLMIATTRPETLFGDTAVAVNPADNRFKQYIKMDLNLPLTKRKIKVIADSFVALDFGTGAVKITPAHDPHDRDCGIRHNLPVINILNPDGTLNENVPEEYRGLDCLTARKKVVEALKLNGLLVKQEPLSHEVGHCYRCNTIIEPYLSKQWFVKMDTMAKKALKALNDKEIVFYPKKWESTYRNWMENIRPWCISRQLWWGHRIPAWYCSDCKKITVSRQDISECEHCHSKKIKQDTDVLDTWFSSWLWPFGTMGWPEETNMLKKYYPTTALVTAYDIIFFWVSRMIMAGLEFMGKSPFRDIYITALVRDKQGRKMSKSLGNGIDPLEVIKIYGSDAMKFTLAYQAAQGQDILIDMDSFKFGSKFANKLWNASRFILMNIEGCELIELENISLNDFDKWILYKLNIAIDKTNEAYRLYKINDAAQIAYDFFWNDFCDWYIELNKSNMQAENKRLKNKTISMLIYLLTSSLKIIHPIMPLITDEIYQKLSDSKGTLAGSEFANKIELPFAKKSYKNVECLKEVIRSMRNIKTIMGIDSATSCEGVLLLDDKDTEKYLNDQKDTITKFANLSDIKFESKRSSQYIYDAGTHFISGIKKSNDFDIAGRIEKIRKDLDENSVELEKCNKKLSNPQFVEKAKKEAVEKENNKKQEYEERIEKLGNILRILEEK